MGVEGRKDGLDLLANIGKKKVRMSRPENMPNVDPNAILAGLDFRRRYLVEGLISHGIIVPSELQTLVHELDHNCGEPKGPGDLHERVLTALFNEERIRNLPDIIYRRSRQLLKLRFKGDVHQARVYKCLVTPTRVCLFPPESETSNDALRQNQRHIDRFLRVQFADEDDRIQINVDVLAADAAAPASGTIARVRRALNSGLMIAGRHYKFLAYSASSAREHACWFMADEDDGRFTVESVRRGLGFSLIEERIVAKHAARMGIVRSRWRGGRILTAALLGNPSCDDCHKCQTDAT